MNKDIFNRTLELVNDKQFKTVKIIINFSKK